MSAPVISLAAASSVTLESPIWSSLASSLDDVDTSLATARRYCAAVEHVLKEIDPRGVRVRLAAMMEGPRVAGVRVTIDAEVHDGVFVPSIGKRGGTIASKRDLSLSQVLPFSLFEHAREPGNELRRLLRQQVQDFGLALLTGRKP